MIYNRISYTYHDPIV